MDIKKEDEALRANYFDASQQPLRQSSEDGALLANKYSHFSENRSVESQHPNTISQEPSSVSIDKPNLELKSPPKTDKRRTAAFIVQEAKETDMPPVTVFKARRNTILPINNNNNLKEADAATPKTLKEKFKLLMKRYLYHNAELMMMTIVTLFALFGPDMKALGLNPDYDAIFNGFFFFVMFLFFVEFSASIWVKPNYFRSFFFWLDLFASLSMVLEIDWILYPIVEFVIEWSLSERGSMTKDFILESKRNHKLSMTIRVLRIIRLIRIVKLYKAAVFFVTNLEKKKMMAKLVKKKLEKEKMLKKREEERRRYLEKKNSRKSIPVKKGSKNKQSIIMNLMNNHSDAVPRETGMAREIRISTENPILGSAANNVNNVNNSNNFKSGEGNNTRLNALLEFQKMKEIEEKIETNQESNISKAASESITQKVIIVILLMLFIAPLTDDDVYYSDSSVSFLILCKFINNFYAVYGNIGESNTIYNRTLESYINNNTDPYYPIIYINYNYTQIWRNKSIDEDVFLDYRKDEKGYAFSEDGYTQIIYSTKIITRLSAGINIARTFFVISVLSYFAVVLEREVKNSVVTPLEAMIDLVDSVAQDPTSYKNIENLRHKVKNSMTKTRTNSIPNNKIQRISTTTQGMITNSGVELEGAEYEIKVIQLAIIKISALLAIGFGEAGGAILKENISSQEGLNPMMPGRKKCAIFGFCDIRGFPDINVALQEKTMVFVNEIADIVHSSVDKFSGSANKNIGDAFLIVWKFPHLEKEPENIEVEVDPMERLKKADEKLNSQIADQAVLGYLHIIKKINKSQKILSYRYNNEIRAKFGDKFKVNMGFGLHVGWGIEGPIGSFYKIDCSYLSPNVNISARLEAASRQYGVTILLSGELYDLLSDELKSICRLIDIIAVKGSKFPIRIYTIHVNDTLKPEKQKRREMSMKEKRKYYQMKKEELKSKFINNKNFSIGKFVLNKKGFRELLIDKKRPVLFYDKFREGFKNYVEGKWDSAYKFFKDAYYLDPSDGPTKTLLNFIKSRNKTAPENWKGYRELTSK